MLNWVRDRQNKSESTSKASPAAKPAENNRRTPTQPVPPPPPPENVSKPQAKNVSVVTPQAPASSVTAAVLQDESPQVRQNAIRDLTRVYDMMSQMSQMLAHAVEDPDADVQTTAKYALNQMNQIRAIPNQKTLPQDNQESKTRKL